MGKFRPPCNCDPLLLAISLYGQQDQRDSSTIVNAVDTFLGFNKTEIRLHVPARRGISDNESDTKNK